jgi:hypothetical protein
MGSIVKKLHEGRIDWPMRGSRMVIEDNIGDDEPIHIHIWSGTNIFRFHFTYKEFEEFAGQVIKSGRI